MIAIFLLILGFTGLPAFPMFTAAAVLIGLGVMSLQSSKFKAAEAQAARCRVAAAAILRPAKTPGSTRCFIASPLKLTSGGNPPQHAS